MDLGCGTGTSSRRLAATYPQASKVIGVDLSPYFLTVARRAPDAKLLGAAEQEAAARVEYSFNDITDTQLPAASVHLVSVCLVIHELPAERTAAVFREAFRLLVPGGTMAIMEMDPEAPGFEKLRSNAMLFSLIRSTEPFLDQYFELASKGQIEELALQAGFSGMISVLAVSVLVSRIWLECFEHAHGGSGCGEHVVSGTSILAEDRRSAWSMPFPVSE